jgi:putative ABC transport system permease protein
MWNGYYEILMDEGGSAPTDPEKNNAHPMSMAAVQPDFFPTFEAPAIAGRLLVPSDYAADKPVVIVVNQSFVKNVLEGRNAIGRRIRFQRKGGDGQLLPDEKIQRWYEIVGVVRDLAMTTSGERVGAGAYVPLNLSAVNSVRLAARVPGDMTAATNALRSIALRADRLLRLDEVQPLSRARDNQVKTLGYISWLFGVVSVSALVLALSGIYAVMSFAVSRRTREIGIRVALGSSRSRVALTVLRRPLIQMAMGIAIGGALTCLWISVFGFTVASAFGAAGYLLAMILVCLLACAVPARRALKVDPIAALRVD